jgi:Ca-activated chloride channel family protein
VDGVSPARAQLSAWARPVSIGALVVACGALAVFGWQALSASTPSMELLGSRIELLDARWLGLLAALPLLPLLSSRSLADLPRTRRALSLLARALLCAALLLALARPSQTFDATRVGAVLLVDTSASISDADLEHARSFVREAAAARGDDSLELVTFDARPRRLPAPDAPLVRAPQAAGLETDLQAAVQLGYGLLTEGALPRLVLLSDGRQTRGDLLAEAERAARLGVSIDHVLLQRARSDETAVTALELPPALRVGEPFELRARVFSTAPRRARLKLFQDGVLGSLDGIRDVELPLGESEHAFRAVVRASGEVTYRVEVTPEGADLFAENNAVSSVAVVPGRPRVLVVDSEPGQLSAFAQALFAQDFEVEVRGAAAMPRSLAELARNDFVIVSDVPEAQMPAASVTALQQYVRDLGGGFMMAGGPRAFGLGGYQGTAMEDLLPVRMDSERRRDEHTLALALVIDASGSMAGAKIELAKEAARATAELLGGQDALAVIAFASQPERLVRMQNASNRTRISQNIGRMQAQGGTSIFPALDAAFQDLLTTTARVKHVILLTDGQTQETGIPELVQAMHAEGLTISTVGLGTDVNRGLLQQIAGDGGGRAYLTTDATSVPRIFVRETNTVGQNSAVEVLTHAVPVEPADFLRGVDVRSAPLLRGYVATQAKPRPAQVVLATESADPLLARMRVGLGWSLAWTSDWKPRWAPDWLRWRAFPAFVAQLVREHMRERAHDELPMQARVVGGELVVGVDAIGPDDRFMNGLEAALELDGPMEASTRAPRAIALRQRAPGRYEARLPLDRYGTFALSTTLRREGRAVARSHGQVSHPYPQELAVIEPDAALLARVSARTGGRQLASAAEVFDARGQSVLAHRELWARFVLAGLALFLVDLALRRAARTRA